MCDVPSIAVFCRESIECLPGIVSKFFRKLLDTIPVAPIVTGTIVHFRFQFRCISIHKLLYFNFFSASFCTTFLSAGIATSIYLSIYLLACLPVIIIITLLSYMTFTVKILSLTHTATHFCTIIAASGGVFVVLMQSIQSAMCCSKQ